MDPDNRSSVPDDPEPAPPDELPRPIWCWQGLLSVGLVGAWTVYLISGAFYPFTNTSPGLFTHFLVMAISLLFGGLELRKLFQNRYTTLGLMLAMVGIGGAFVVTYFYLQSYGMTDGCCCHGV